MPQDTLGFGLPSLKLTVSFSSGDDQQVLVGNSESVSLFMWTENFGTSWVRVGRVFLALDCCTTGLCIGSGAISLFRNT